MQFGGGTYPPICQLGQGETMSHYQMDSEGRNGASEVTYKLYKDGELISFGKWYGATFDIVLKRAASTDTFSDYEGGEPRWSLATLRGHKLEQKAKTK